MKRRSFIRALSLVLVVCLFVSLFPAIPGSLAMGQTYKIANEEQLKMYVNASENSDFDGDILELTDDIQITDKNFLYSFNRNADVPFRGTFNGNGFTITGLNYDRTLGYKAQTGLFANTQNATIENLIIDKANLDADSLGGIVAGYAENTRFVNLTVKNSDQQIDCADNVLTLITDGGLVAGGLVGATYGCTLYNCEVSNTYIHTAATSAVAALGGKGLYIAGLVGAARDNTVIEYCRVTGSHTNECPADCTEQHVSRVKNHYDVAVGALGGNKIYVGGLIGQMQSGSKVIDSFSTAELNYYCATYVSVGAGNIGYAGGIAAAVYGDSCEITRCHYAGEMTGKQYNAVIAIPIIQENINLSGIAERYSGGTVTDSFFKESMANTSDTLDSEQDSTAEYGPQSDEKYIDRSFWESHGYDFTGNIMRSTAYDDNHINKWVMDFEHGIPVHGKSVAAGFDFPNAGTVTIGASDLVGKSVSTDSAWQFAVQGIQFNEQTVNLTATENPGYRFVRWYKVPDVLATSVPENDHTYYDSIIDNPDLATTDPAAQIVWNDAACEDNDFYLAYYEAQVLFRDISGAIINKTTGTSDAGTPDISDDWYRYDTPLPEAIPVNKPVDENARLIGWTTIKNTNETGGGYSNITMPELESLKTAGEFYATGAPIRKTMDLYPVYASLISNISVLHEGHEQDSSSNTSLRESVGYTTVMLDDNNAIHLSAQPYPQGSATYPDGYRFLGWYEWLDETDRDSAICVSRDQNAVLANVELTKTHTYEARFEYRLDFWSVQKQGSGTNGANNKHFQYADLVNDAWVNYGTVVFPENMAGDAGDPKTWLSPYVSDLRYRSNYASLYDYEFLRWTTEINRKNADGSLIWYDPDTLLAIAADTTNYPAYPLGTGINGQNQVVSPMSFEAVFQGQHDEHYYLNSIATDFPNSGSVSHEGSNGASVTPYDRYNFIFFDIVGRVAKDDSDISSSGHAYFNNSGSKSGTSRTDLELSGTKYVFDSGLDLNIAGRGRYTHYFTAHMTADVNFYNATGTALFGNSIEVSKTQFPHLSESKTVTMTRRYQSLLFGNANNSYNTYTYKSLSNKKVSITLSHAEMGMAPTAIPSVDGYYFVGWIDPDAINDNEQAYVCDLANGVSNDGQPLYISSKLETAKLYVLTENSVVTRAMDLYPLYVPIADVEYTTNIERAGVPDGINKPANPGGLGAKVPEIIVDNNDGTQTITMTPDVSTFVTGNSGEMYKLTSMYIEVDGGDLILLDEDTDINGNKMGTFTYTVTAGHQYVFVANYEPSVVVYHLNDTDIDVKVRDNGSIIGTHPIPTYDIRSVIETGKTKQYLFVGWTETEPADGYHTSVEGLELVPDNRIVTYSMELWPVYRAIEVTVNSNIDAVLSDPAGVRYIQKNSEDICTASLVATSVDNYAFVGWYTDFVSNDNAGTLVSTSLSYPLEQSDLFTSTVYTAVYKPEPYLLVYHGINGEDIYSVEIFEDDERGFITETTYTPTDEDGNPIGETVSTITPVDQDAFLSLYESLAENQIFKRWNFINDSNELIQSEEFFDKQVVAYMDSKNIRRMDLYPEVQLVTAKDSKGDTMTTVSTSSDEAQVPIASISQDGKNTITAALNVEYDQPTLTIHIDSYIYRPVGYDTTVIPVSGEEVELFPQGFNGNTKYVQSRSTDAAGNAVFTLFGMLTLKKTLDGESAPDAFLFRIKTTAGDVVCNVVIAANETVNITLPYGSYVVEEDAKWAWRYDAVQLNGTVSNVDKTLILDNISKTEKWFDSTDRVKNVFGHNY